MTPAHLAPLPGADHPTVSLPVAPAFPPQAFPIRALPSQAFPTQAFPTQEFPTQAFPTQAFPTQAFPAHEPPTIELGHLDRAPAPSAPRGMRIGDAERDRTCEVLASHFAAGRLAPAELDERTTRAVMATTQAELLRLTADLPASGLPSSVPTTRPAPVWPHDCASAHPLPATRPRSDAGRSVIMTLWGLLTGAATLCTMLLLLGVAAQGVAGLVWLAAFGTAVASSGITYFVTRGSTAALHPSR